MVSAEIQNGPTIHLQLSLWVVVVIRRLLRILELKGMIVFIDLIKISQESWQHAWMVRSLILGTGFFFSFAFCILGPYPQHVEVPRLGVEAEPQLPACTTATAMTDPSRVCDLHHSSWQHRILNPLSQSRDRTRNLMDTSWVCYR